MKSPPDSEPSRLAGGPVLDVDRLQRLVAVHGRDLGAAQHADVRPRRELVDQVARHALLQPVAAAEDRHAARVGREVHGRLPRRVAGSHDVDVEAVGAARLAARRAVGDALPKRRSQPSIGSFRHETPHARMIVRAPSTSPPSRCTCRRDRVEPVDRPGDEDLRAESLRLPQRPISQLLARDARSGSRGSSRSSTRTRPGRPGSRARSRSCAVLPMPRRRPPPVPRALHR